MDNQRVHAGHVRENRFDDRGEEVTFEFLLLASVELLSEMESDPSPDKITVDDLEARENS